MNAAAPAVIFGAGRTGRGLAARLCARAGRPFVLVERDPALADALAAAGTYPLRILGGTTEMLHPLETFRLDDLAWHAHLHATDLACTAVVGTAIPGLGERLRPVLAVRPVGLPLAILTCENDAEAAAALARTAQPPPGAACVAAMVLTTCLGPGPGDPPLALRTQDLARLPCDGAALSGPPPLLDGLEPLPRFAAQLQRKLYTYNGINAVLSYLGAARGHVELAQAAADPAVAEVARHAGDEAGRALVAEHGFDPAEQETWAREAMAKFADPAIPDPIARNAADPARKLRRDDRLVGPALLALRHGIRPLALAAGIVQAVRYRDGGAPSLAERHGSLAAALAACGLGPDEPLCRLVVEVASA